MLYDMQRMLLLLFLMFWVPVCFLDPLLGALPGQVGCFRSTQAYGRVPLKGALTREPEPLFL